MVLYEIIRILEFFYIMYIEHLREIITVFSFTWLMKKSIDKLVLKNWIKHTDSQNRVSTCTDILKIISI